MGIFRRKKKPEDLMLMSGDDLRSLADIVERHNKQQERLIAQQQKATRKGERYDFPFGGKRI